MKKRNTSPRLRESDLATRHAQAHWRRISSAKARTDTSTPESFKHHLEARNVLQKRDKLATGRKGVVGAHKSNREREHCCWTVVLFDKDRLGSDPQACSSPHRWCLYHTATGRAAGYCQELWKTHLNTLAPSLHLAPWKPAFTVSPGTPLLPSLSPDHDHSSLRRNAPNTFTSTGYVGDVIATDFEKMLLTESFPVVSIYDERRDRLNESEIIHISGPTDTKSDDQTVSHNVPNYRYYLLEKNKEIRRRLEESVCECEYLDFVSNITKDIVARGFTSEAGLESLFTAHVIRNKHQLREDILWQKISILKNELTF